MRTKAILSILVIMLLGLVASAQTKYRGKVVDSASGESIPGAIVVEKGTSNGTSSDIDGNFVITINGAGTISISYIGYKTREIKITPSRTNLGRIEMAEDASTLGEVVVVGSSLIDIVKDRQTPIAATTLTGPQVIEKMGNLDFPEALKGVPSVHTINNSGYGDASFTVRGFDQANVLVLINGQPVNDMEWGGIYWSNWAGVADVASVVQQQRGLGSSKIGISSVGGTTNIVTKAADRQQGGSLKLVTGNDGYFKSSVSYDSGLQGKWAISALLSYWRGNGYVDYTPGQGGTYFLSIGYKLNDHHSFNFTTTGAPQVHGQGYRESINTYEKYGRKYNSNWGYRDGKPFSFSTNFYHKPIANFNWDWTINDKTTLSTVVYGSWGYGGGTGTFGTPHYKIPDDENGLIKVDDLVRANMGETVDKIPVTPAWDGSKLDNRNGYWSGKRIVTQRGGGTVLRSSMNNHSWYGLLSSLDAKVGEHWTLNAGVDLRTYVGKHYRVINDLLGADAYYENVDVNSAGVFVSDVVSLNPLAVSEMQNAQKVNRNFDSHVAWTGLFGQVEYNNEHVSAFVQGSVSSQFYKRHEYFEVPTSEQWTKWSNRIGGNIKGGVNWKINRQNNIFLNAGYFSRQPFFSSIYPNSYTPRANEMQKGIKNEGITSVEGGYIYNSAFARVALNAYFTQWKDRYQSFSADVSGERRQARTYVDQVHAGVELETTVHPTSFLDLFGMISYGSWKYGSTAVANIYDNQNRPVEGEKPRLFLDNVPIGGAPQFQTRLGMKAYIIKGLSADLNWYFNDRNYAQINAVSYQKEGTNNLKLPSYSTLDGGISYRYSFKETSPIRGLSFRLNVNNILDTKYIARGSSNIAADKNADNNWKGINKKNTVAFGYGRTWSLSASMTF